MQKISLLVIFHFLFVSIFCQTKNTDKYIIDTLRLKSEIFNNTRTIRVLLPPGYYDPANKLKEYPVLYLNDGIAVFHAYNLKTTVHSLIKNQVVVPFIVVGIDNGGSTEESTNPVRDRAEEYLPWTDSTELNPDLRVEKPKGSLYCNFLLTEVIPLVKTHFRVKKGRESTGIGGSSYGALIALYTYTKYPNEFGLLLLESPSLYVSNKQVLQNARDLKTWPEKIYVGIGDREGETRSIQNMALKDTHSLIKLIRANSATTKIQHVIEKKGQHGFPYFAKRFPKAISFLFKK